MRLIGVLAATVAAVTGTATAGQSAVDAFECKLPYHEAIQSLTTLEVINQSRSPGLAILNEGPYETVEFAPGSLRVFGDTPRHISLIAREPAANARDKVYKVTFQTRLSGGPELNRAIVESQVWHLGHCVFGLCIRAEEANPEGAGSLNYHRYEALDEENDFYGWLPYSIECVFEFTEKELAELEG